MKIQDRALPDGAPGRVMARARRRTGKVSPSVVSPPMRRTSRRLVPGTGKPRAEPFGDAAGDLSVTVTPVPHVQRARRELQADRSRINASLFLSCDLVSIASRTHDRNRSR